MILFNPTEKNLDIITMNTNNKFYMTFRGGNCVLILGANLFPKNIMPFFQLHFRATIWGTIKT